MSVLDREHVEETGAKPGDARPLGEAAALWSALEADRRSRDERLDRLRAMRLILGEDARA